jgi:hypothetical protein
MFDTLCFKHSLRSGCEVGGAFASDGYEQEQRVADPAVAGTSWRQARDPRNASWRLAATGTADAASMLRAVVIARREYDYRKVETLLDALSQERRTAALDVVHGEAPREPGRRERAENVFAGADRRTPGGPQETSAAISRATNLLWTSGQSRKALEMMAAARARTHDPVARRSLYVNEAVVRVFPGEPREAVHVLDLELPGSAGDGTDLTGWLRGAMTRGAGLAAVGRVTEAVTWTKRVRAKLRDAHRHTFEVHPAAAVSPLVFALTEHGRLTEALDVGARGYGELAAASAIGAQAWLALPSHVRN